jgi:hypothetical protein
VELTRQANSFDILSSTLYCQNVKNFAKNKKITEQGPPESKWRTGGAHWTRGNSRGRHAMVPPMLLLAMDVSKPGGQGILTGQRASLSHRAAP